MARTPYADPEAEKAYQEISDGSSRPSAFEDERLSDTNEGNRMLRDRATGPLNVKTNKKNGY